MVHSHTVQTMILATGSALALITAALGDHAQAESSLDASYTWRQGDQAAEVNVTKQPDGGPTFHSSNVAGLAVSKTTNRLATK